MATPNTTRDANDLTSTSPRIGTMNPYNIQRLAMNKVCNILGPSIWQYGYLSGRRCRNMKHVHEQACLASGHTLVILIYDDGLFIMLNMVKQWRCPKEQERKRNQMLVVLLHHKTLLIWFQSSLINHNFTSMKYKKKWKPKLENDGADPHWTRPDRADKRPKSHRLLCSKSNHAGRFDLHLGVYSHRSKSHQQSATWRGLLANFQELYQRALVEEWTLHDPGKQLQGRN